MANCRLPMLFVLATLLTPTVAYASDFSGLAWIALAIIVGVTLACLIAGLVTAGILVLVTKRRWLWFLTPLFAVGWFAVGWLVMDLLGT